MKPRGRCRVAWKVFLPEPLRYEFYRHHGRRNVRTNRWLLSERGPGFFVFLMRRRALKWRDTGKVVRKVFVREVVLKGPLTAHVGWSLVETYPTCAIVRWLFVPERS